jgi:formamidopyrimidine-DNA glycosylase
LPELPEIEALTNFLHEKTRGSRVERCELAAVAALKTFDPPISSVVGQSVKGVARRGKYLSFELDDASLVLHLARGGWVKWSDPLPLARAKLGRGPLALRLAFSSGAGVDVTEAGKEKRLAIWLVRDPNDVEGVRSLGADPTSASFRVEVLGALLASESGTIKHVLTIQSVIAGIGNAYSDEILHAAKLSPFKAANKLLPEEIAQLHAALRKSLRDAIESASGLSPSELKEAKRRAMSVHGRSGLPCPVCGDTIREVAYSTKSLQYCPTCQTGGRVLADRRFSRLLK